MSLRFTLKAVPETLQEFQLAANDRLLDAQVLYNAGRMNACIYNAGYAAEMLLKCSCVRFRGASPSSEIASYFVPLRTMASPWSVSIDNERNHSLRYWAIVLQEIRKQAGRPLDSIGIKGFEVEFEIVTERLYNSWFVEMRYRRETHDKKSALQAIQDVIWLRTNYNYISKPDLSERHNANSQTH